MVIKHMDDYQHIAPLCLVSIKLLQFHHWTWYTFGNWIWLLYSSKQFAWNDIMTDLVPKNKIEIKSFGQITRKKLILLKSSQKNINCNHFRDSATNQRWMNQHKDHTN
jgi:hypothetical protein